MMQQIRLHVALFSIWLVLPQCLFAQQQSADSTMGEAESIRITDQPQLLVSLSPQSAASEGIYPRSQLVFTLRVVSKHPFDALSIDMPPFENAETIELAPAKTKHVKSYSGTGYVHERRFALFATDPGTLLIPEITAQGFIAVDENQIAFADNSDAIAVQIKTVPAGFEGDWWLVSPAVAIQESWSIPPDQLRYGDIVTRTIKLTVAGVDEYRLPELQYRQTQGTQVSELSSTRETIKSSSGLTAVLEKSWSIQIPHQDVVHISPIGLTYWDAKADQPARIAVQAQRIEPLVEDSEAIAAGLLQQAGNRYRLAHWLTSAIMLSVALMLVGIVAYVLSKWYSLPGDYRFRRDFMSAPSGPELIRVWREWVAAERFHSCPSWQQLNNELQRKVYSRNTSNDAMTRIERDAFLNRSIRHMRRYRLNRLRTHIEGIATFVLAEKRELARISHQNVYPLRRLLISQRNF